MNGLTTIALAWKESRQLLAITLAISICAIINFVIANFLERLVPFSNPLEIFNSIVPATLTTITIAMAGAVIAVGGERQSGQWHWMTTLPVTWLQAFAVKLSVILLMATIAGAIVFGIIVAIHLAFSASPLSYGPSIGGHDYRLMLFAMPVALFWSIIMCLCVREPMIAIMLAAIITLIEGLVKNWMLEALVSSAAPASFGPMAIATAIESLLLLFFALASFKAGWFYNEPILSSLVTPNVSSDTLAIRTRWGTWENPSSGWAILWQSAKGQIWPIILLSVFTLIAYPLFGFHVGPLVMILTALLPCVLGIFTLSGEQNRRQFRVIADRGFSSRRYLLFRTLLPIALVSFSSLVLAPLLATTNTGNAPAVEMRTTLLLFGMSLGIYFAFVFSTLTFANPLLALFSGIVIAISIGYGIVAPVFAGGWLGLWIAVPLSLIAVALPWLLVKRWMRYEIPHLILVALASVVVISLTPLTVFTPLRAYSIPKQDLPTANTNLRLQSQPANLAGAFLDKQHYSTLLKAILETQATLPKGMPVDHTILDQLNSLESQMESTSPLAGASTENASKNGEQSPSDIDQVQPHEALKLKLEDLKKTLQTPLDARVEPESWWYFGNGSSAAEWLSMVIYYAMLKEDQELLTVAVDAYASIIDPRYPAEFSLYQIKAYFLTTGLANLQGRASPKMYATIFDRLIQNVPDQKVWENFYISEASPERSAQRTLRPEQNFYAPDNGMAIFSGGERERYSRVLALAASMNIRRCSPQIVELNRVKELAATKQLESGSVERPSPQVDVSLLKNPYRYMSNDGEIDQLIGRYNSGEYGTVKHYIMPDQAVVNLGFYINILQVAASGSQSKSE